MVVKSIVQRLKNKFNVSVGEVHEQDIHQIIVIGISAVCGDQKQVDSTLENLIDFVEENTDAEIQAVDSVCRIKSYISDQTGWSVTFSGVTDLFLCDNFADLCILRKKEGSLSGM